MRLNCLDRLQIVCKVYEEKVANVKSTESGQKSTR